MQIVVTQRFVFEGLTYEASKTYDVSEATGQAIRHNFAGFLADPAAVEVAVPVTSTPPARKAGHARTGR
jgi:hypothetical protein